MGLYNLLIKCNLISGPIVHHTVSLNYILTLEMLALKYYPSFKTLFKYATRCKYTVYAHEAYLETLRLRKWAKCATSEIAIEVIIDQTENLSAY